VNVLGGKGGELSDEWPAPAQAKGEKSTPTRCGVQMCLGKKGGERLVMGRGGGGNRNPRGKGGPTRVLRGTKKTHFERKEAQVKEVEVKQKNASGPAKPSQAKTHMQVLSSFPPVKGLKGLQWPEHPLSYEQNEEGDPIIEESRLSSTKKPGRAPPEYYADLKYRMERRTCGLSRLLEQV